VCAARAFLNEHREGIYSVVVRTDAISAATESMRSRGAELTYGRAGRRRLHARGSTVRTGIGMRSLCSKQITRRREDIKHPARSEGCEEMARVMNW